MAYRRSSPSRSNGGGMMMSMSSPASNNSNGHNHDLDANNNNNPGDVTFLMEHLATFPVADGDSPNGVVFAADGMRKLLQLEKTTGIWSQRMDITLAKRKQVVQILDHESKSVIENFPIDWIGQPTPFKNSDPMEMYNNIVVFTVEPPQSKSSGRGNSKEMHIFQCRNVDANTLCDYLNAMKYQGNNATPYDLNNNNSNGDYANRRHQQQETSVAMPVRKTNIAYHNPNPTASSATAVPSDLYERDVHVLNYCFDDIEKFIARLHHLASATKEMERRRRYSSRSNGNWTGAGEGMLSVRTRPPTENDFLDIFAKFKLSFNLLAKLKAYIHDPNAPELVHFLFTPLALIVDAAKDITAMYHQRSPQDTLTALVITPFFTNGTINLLSNCVTSRESELWKSLGDPWTLTRQQFLAKHKNVDYQDYHPVFFDGWTPDFQLVFPDEQELDRPMRSGMTSPMERAFGELNDILGDDTESITSIEHRIFPAPPNGEAEITVWLRDLELRNAKVVCVTYPRTANNDKELTVTRGEILEIIDDTRKWWRARNIHGQVGFVPHTIVARYNVDKNGDAILDDADDDVFQNPVYSRASKAFHRESRGPSMSSFAAPSPPPMTPSPSNMQHQALLHQIELHSEMKQQQQQHHQLREEPVSSRAPPPPPLPPLSIPTTPILRPARSEPVTPKSMKPQEAYGMQEELKHVLSHVRDNRRNMEIVKTPNIYIQQSASQAEVQHWLRAKGFSEAIITRLQNLNGTRLFALQRKQLEEICGVEEGRRMHSQITVQRNVSGYQTARSSELRAILAKARQKMEEPVQNGGGGSAGIVSGEHSHYD